MKICLRRNNTTVRYWINGEPPKERRVPKNANPFDFLEQVRRELQAKFAPNIYDLLESEIENFLKVTTQKTYRYAIKIAREHNPPGDWTKSKAANFALTLHEKGYTKKSVDLIFTALRSLWNWAETHERINQSNPFNCKYRLPINEPTRFAPLTEKQLSDLKKELENDKEALNLINLIEFTMIRPAEIERLKPEHYNAENCTILVPADLAKNNRARLIFYPSSLDIRPPKHTVEVIRKRIHRAMRKIGIKVGKHGSSLYSIKHTSAKRLLEKSNLETVKNQAGHLSIVSTEAYTDRLKNKTAPKIISDGW